MSVTIDGNSEEFYDTTITDPEATYRAKNYAYPIRSWRLGQMIYFCPPARGTSGRLRPSALFGSSIYRLERRGGGTVEDGAVGVESGAVTIAVPAGFRWVPVQRASKVCAGRAH